MGSTFVPNDKLVEAVLDIELKAPVTVGLMLSNDNPPKITKLLPSSNFLGKLFVGDMILTINEQKIANIGDFFKFCKPGKIAVRYKRDEYCTCTTKNLPRPKPDVEAFEFQFVWRTGGMPIGILVYQDQEKRIIVSMVENGTVASHMIRPGDILTKVNDIGCNDKEVAKKSILESVNAQRRVKLTIERPGAAEAPKSTVSTPGEVAVVPQAPKGPNYDLPLPPDVLAIMDANRDSCRKQCTNPGIIKNLAAGPVACGNGKKLGISDATPEENVVEYDPSEKPLKATPKRVGAA